MTVSREITRAVGAASPGDVIHTDTFGHGRPAVSTALSRMARRGELIRVRRGLYRKPLVSRFGQGVLSSEVVALYAGAGKAPGPAGPSAALSLGLSTQVPLHAAIAVVGAPPTAVNDVVFISRSNFERVAARLRPQEVALLEILRDDLAWVEVDHASVRDRIRVLIENTEIDPKRLRRAAVREPLRVRKALLDIIGSS